MIEHILMIYQAIIAFNLSKVKANHIPGKNKLIFENFVSTHECAYC